MASATVQSPSTEEVAQVVTRPLRWLPWLLLMLGAFITWRLDSQQQHNQQALEQVRFHREAAEVVNALERQLQDTVTILRGVSGLFISSEVVTRQEFSKYVQTLQLNTAYSGIQGVGFARWIPASQVPGHQAEVRAEGFADFAVHPLAPARPYYSSIVYLEPFDWRNRRAFGYDMYSEPVRQAAMRQAVESGLPALSGRITLVQETDQDVQSGVLMYVPIYKPGPSLATAVDRWRALRGWAYAPLRSGDLVASFMATGKPSLSTRFGIELFAGPQATAETRLYKSEATDGRGMPQWIHDEVVPLLGAHWLVRVSGPINGQGYGAGEASHQAALYGGAFTALMAILAHVILRGRQRMAGAYRETVVINQQLKARQAELRLAATVMNASPIGIVVTDAQRRIVSVNPSFSRITGYAADDVQGRQPWALGPSEAAAIGADADAWHMVDQTGRWAGELTSSRKDGSVYPTLLTIVREVDPDRETVHYIGLLQDITDRRQQEDQIRHMALHDYLTGLGNRALLIERATQELIRAKRYGNRPALLFIDLDRFKPINDIHGHDAGDAVLKAIAQRLKDNLRGADLVCRQGGDEFIVLLPDHDNPAALIELANKLAGIVAQPVGFGELTLSVGASIGIATYPDHGSTVETLIQSADEAMYCAKARPDRRVWLAGLPVQSSNR